MRTILVPLIQTLRVTFRSRAALQLEILALRQQLAVLHHSGPKRPHLGPVDRFFWAFFSKLWPGLRNPLIIVKPDTVIGWSRKDFPPFTVAKILNHAEREVTAVYDRHSYDQEKRQALEAWGARLILTTRHTSCFTI